MSKNLDYFSVATNGDIQGLQIITGLLAQGWDIGRVDASGGRFIYIFTRAKTPQGPPLMLSAPNKNIASTLKEPAYKPRRSKKP